MQKIGVIGSGIAGIASAIRLKVAGFEVDVYEKNSFPGGKLSSFELGNYRFDAGPSLFTLPNLVLDLYKIAKENPSEFPYIIKNESCRYFWNDGSSFTAKSDKNSFIKEASSFFGEPDSAIKNYLKNGEELYESAGQLFLEKPLNKATTWLSKNVLKTFKTASISDLLGNLNQKNEQFFKSEKLIQLFNRYATYNGSNPYSAPGMLSMIPHLEHGVGTFLPKNGMHQITDSLYKLASKLGVNFHFNSNVTKIIVRNSNLKGIEVNGKEVLLNKVISNAD